MSHVSHSQVTQWLRCGKSYQLARIQHAPRDPAVWSVVGKALHAVIDQINRSYMSGETLDIKATWSQELQAEVDLTMETTSKPPEQWRRGGRVSKEKPNREDLDWWNIEGLRELFDYQRFLSLGNYKIHAHEGTLLSEFETTATFGGQTVKGYLDAVYEDTRTGQLIVVDAKSGTRTPTNYLQLGLYAEALRRVLGMEVNVGAFFMTRKAELTEPAPVTRYAGEYFDRVFEQMGKALENKIFIANPGDACYSCDVATACYAKGGVDAWKLDPDSPDFNPA